MHDCNYIWRNALDNSDAVHVIIIDFYKVFNVVLHAELINKLTDLGLCLNSLWWLQVFLALRIQVVCINDTTFEPIGSLITSRIVQDRVIGLMLFVSCINDILLAYPNCVLNLFADDDKASK